MSSFLWLPTRCTSCHERFERLPPAPFGARQSVCPRCEEGELREEMHAHDVYTYLEELQFYLSGDVTSQQKVLLQRCPPELSAVIMRHQRKGGGVQSQALHPPQPAASGLSVNGGPGGGASAEPKDSWFVPVVVDANLVVHVLSEGQGKPPSARERLEVGGDCLEAAYRRVREAEVPPIKRGVELRYPHAVAAYVYLEKTRHGAAWVDMQQEREKLRQVSFLAHRGEFLQAEVAVGVGFPVPVLLWQSSSLRLRWFFLSFPSTKKAVSFSSSLYAVRRVHCLS